MIFNLLKRIFFLKYKEVFYFIFGYEGFGYIVVDFLVVF